VKNFKEEFDRLLSLVASSRPFCFTRFSDGEVTILRNKPLVLGDSFLIQGDIYADQKIPLPSYAFKEDEERKSFIPQETPFLHEKLVEAFKYRKKNYFKGISGQNGQDGKSSWEFCVSLYGEGDLDHLTFSNVLINDNYRFFISDMLPLFATKKIVLISNKNSKLDRLPFKVVKHFGVGPNCMKDDYYLIDACKDWIQKNKITDHLFLFSAASLSNLLGYELYKDYGENQYMDIGSSLGPHLQLEGWKAMRTYLKTYWENPAKPAPQQVDLWK